MKSTYSELSGRADVKWTSTYTAVYLLHKSVRYCAACYWYWLEEIWAMMTEDKDKAFVPIKPLKAAEQYLVRQSSHRIEFRQDDVMSPNFFSISFEIMKNGWKIVWQSTTWIWITSHKLAKMCSWPPQNIIDKNCWTSWITKARSSI